MKYVKLSDENIDLDLKKSNLEEILIKKKDKLIYMRDDLLSV